MRMSDETFAGGGSSGGLSGSGSFKRDGVASNIVSNRGANVCWHETEIVTAAPSVRGCGGAEAPSMEFVFTDGEDTWDNAPGGGNYSASVRVNRRPDAAGAQRVVIRVADGSVDLQHVFPRVLLVSDLDGTMVGDDAKTKRFREFWDGTGARGNGSRLIYSTGRSLPSFQVRRSITVAMQHATRVRSPFSIFDGSTVQRTESSNTHAHTHTHAHTCRGPSLSKIRRERSSPSPTCSLGRWERRFTFVGAMTSSRTNDGRRFSREDPDGASMRRGKSDTDCSGNTAMRRSTSVLRTSRMSTR